MPEQAAFLPHGRFSPQRSVLYKACATILRISRSKHRKVPPRNSPAVLDLFASKALPQKRANVKYVCQARKLGGLAFRELNATNRMSFCIELTDPRSCQPRLCGKVAGRLVPHRECWGKRLWLALKTWLFQCLHLNFETLQVCWHHQYQRIRHVAVPMAPVGALYTQPLGCHKGRQAVRRPHWAGARRPRWTVPARHWAGRGLRGFRGPTGTAAPFGCVSKPKETPGEHQNRWQMDVHPPQNGAIGYAPWPFDSKGVRDGLNPNLTRIAAPSLVFSVCHGSGGRG